VIGADRVGTIARVPTLRNDPRDDLVAIEYHDRDTAERTAREFDVPHACTTADQVLDLGGLDAAVVRSTPHLHYPQAKAALERVLHILVEKPMTFTVEQVQTLVELAAQQDRQLIIGCTFHITNHAAEAQGLIRDSELGQIK